MPVWRKPWAQGGKDATAAEVKGDGRDIVLFGDTFNRYFERENLEAAERVLAAGGYRLHRVAAKDGGRPLCCGRTFLSAGLVDEARAEARRQARYLAAHVRPTRATTALYPRRTMLAGLAGLFLLLGWGSLAIIAYNVRDTR